MAIFRLFQIWRPLSQRGLPGPKKRRTRKLWALDGLSVEGLIRFLVKYLLKNLTFSAQFFIFQVLSLPIFAIFLKMTCTGGNPWPNFSRDKPFGMFPAFSAFWDSRFKVILLRKLTKIFRNFFSSCLGSKK